MTTARSPLRVLKAQADGIAMRLKAAERGEKITNDPAGKIAAARAKPAIEFAVVMDDQIIIIEMTWKAIHDTTEAGIVEYILKQMRQARDPVQ